ncbi:hypothetical protein BEP19_05000 [Ammoniphilus oxalaticus]|uniref:histidine kinase n=1 Tax=Ammoniphilus oxalaticus TaxID=66863 RepID=A0A419SIK6_9BACL|nr:ATP-binding protein [Ammoniphilus oxalaticus]RKD23789.1 hypothetical protein BEP19_05000 [Ammoniphilus oxalaticus]
MRSLSFRLNIIIISLMSITLLFVGLYVADLVKKVYTDTLATQLFREATVIGVYLENQPFNRGQIDQQVERFASDEHSRITLIDIEGNVLADTEAEPQEMNNHRDREEIIEALNSGDGQAIRYSNTLDQRMVYVAHVLNNSRGDPIGVVRLSMSIQKIDDFIHNLWFSLTFGIGSALLLTIIVSLFVSRYVTKPLEKITAVARKITEKKFDTRVHIRSKGEIGQLADALNFMASSLESQMIEIKQNEEKLFGVLNNMTSGVILIGESRRVLFVNSAIGQFLGYSEQSLIGKLHTEAGMNLGLSKLIARCFQTGEKIRDEAHIYFPNELIVDASLAPYTTEHGEVKGVVIVLHDITAIRRLEKIRSDFVANVSHELKTPITSIKGFAETLLDGAIDDPDISKQFLEIIYNESDRFHRLINDILDLSQIEQKKLPLRIERVDIFKLIEDIVQSLQEKMNRKELVYERPIDDTPIYMEGDCDRLRQIIINLIDNAISYTAEKGRITVEVEELSDQVVLKVRDNGIGIPHADRDRIFERFYRVDKGRSRNSGGTGLGLAIVKHLVESHHGTIRIESEEGQGSVFILQFPKAQPHN